MNFWNLLDKILPYHRDRFANFPAYTFSETEICSRHNGVLVKSFLGDSLLLSSFRSYFLRTCRNGQAKSPCGAFVTLLTMMEGQKCPCSNMTSLNKPTNPVAFFSANSTETRNLEVP